MNSFPLTNIVPLSECPEVIPQLSSWQHAEWGFLRPGDTLAERRERLRASTEHSGLPAIWVARWKGLLVGSAALYSHDFPEEPDWSPWLASVIVAKPFRGRGFGQQLVHRVEVEAARMGFEVLYLFTENARDFYATIGYQEIGRRPHLASGVDVVLMKRKLG